MVTCKECMRKSILTILLCFAVLIGIILGFILRAYKLPWSQREIMYIGFVGDIFLRLLKVLILPLIFFSIVSAVGDLDLRLSGRIGGRAVAFYMSTTFIAVILGIVLVLAIRPGRGFKGEQTEPEVDRNITTVDTLLDLIRNVFTDNLIKACVFQYHTKLIYPPPTVTLKELDPSVDTDDPSIKIVKVKSKNGSIVEMQEITKDSNLPITEWRMKSDDLPNTNILGIVFFAVVFGIVISYQKEKAAALLSSSIALTEAMMVLTQWVMWLAPIGIIFLIASKILEMENFGLFAGKLGMYFLTVFLGLFIHGTIILPLVYIIATRKLPFRFIYNMMEALLTAWATSSSSATLPVTFYCIEEKNGVDPRVSRFVLPIGATMNMDGTALYEAAAAIFIADVRNVHLGIGSIVAISITATAASVGAAGIPQAGLITMVMVLNTVGLPAEDITLIIVVDWLLDRFRTMLNVLGDSLGAGIVYLLSKKDLDKLNHLQSVKNTHVAKEGDEAMATGSRAEV